MVEDKTILQCVALGILGLMGILLIWKGDMSYTTMILAGAIGFIVPSPTQMVGK